MCPSASRLQTSMESTSLFRMSPCYDQAIDNDVRFLVFGFFKGFHRLGQIHNLTVDQKAHITLLLQSGQNDRQPLFRSWHWMLIYANAGAGGACCDAGPSNARRMQRYRRCPRGSASMKSAML